MSAKLSMDELVRAVKDYAINHYDQDGWDWIVEAHTDQEIAELIGTAQTVKRAIQNVRRICKLLHEREREIDSLMSW